MRKSLKSRTLYSLKIAVGLVPWIAAMYGFYWLDASGTWTPDTPHRGKMSVALLATGMMLSFLALSRLNRR
jgi:hypothetical protein